MIFVLILLAKSLVGSCGNETCGTTQSACVEKNGCQWNDARPAECRDKKDAECATLAEAGCTAAGSGCEWISTASCVRKTEPNCDVLNNGACAAGCTEGEMTNMCVANDDKCKKLGDTYGQEYCSSSLTFNAVCGTLSSGDCESQAYMFCEWQNGACKRADSAMNTMCGMIPSSSCASTGGVCKVQGDSCVFNSDFTYPAPSCKWESNTCKFDSSKGSCVTKKDGGGCTEGSSTLCGSENVPSCYAGNCENNDEDTACSSTSVEPFCEWKTSYCQHDSSYSCSSLGLCSSSAAAAGCVSMEASEASCSVVPNLDCASKSTQSVCEAGGCKWTPEDKSLVVCAPLLLIVLSLLMCL